MKKLIMATVLICLTCSPASAVEEAIWMGGQQKDPITDGTNALAFVVFDNQASFAIRCKNSKELDFFIESREPLRRGAPFDAVIRFGSEAPEPIDAIATDTKFLGLKLHGRPDLIKRFLTMDQIAIRYKDREGREHTQAWRAILKPNMLEIVGGALAACGVIPFPGDEIEAARKEILNAGQRDKKAPKSRK